MAIVRRETWNEWSDAICDADLNDNVSSVTKHCQQPKRWNRFLILD